MSAPEPIRCLTLWQPWASLISRGHKQVETRSWATPWRGLLAIHAAQRWTKAEQDSLYTLAGYFNGDDHYDFAEAIQKPPLAAVVALARVSSCEVMTPELIEAQTDAERFTGDWQPGRYAWRLEDVRPLAEPLPLKGRQGMWTLPADVAAEVLARAGGPS